MSSIAERVAVIRTEIEKAALAAGRDPREITLLAATKTQPPERIAQAIAAGIDCAGENRVQEMMDKLSAYGSVPLHFIGRLQRNKAKFVVGRCALIHSVDSLPLLETINRIAENKNIIQPVLLEINIGKELSKGGFMPSDAQDAAYFASKLPHIRLDGLMCIPPAGTSGDINANFFEKTRKLYVDIRTKMMDNDTMTILSMGMSEDYQIAIVHGSTVIRVGSGIFGMRMVT